MKGIDIAKTMLGLQEKKDRVKLIDFFTKHSIRGDIVVDPSQTPWCACFVNACERAAGKKGTGLQNARSFLNYGEEIELKDAKEGDILIFKRGNSSWQGHVTYLYKDIIPGVQYKSVRCLGGNQGDSVSASLYSLDGLLGIRRSL